MTSGRGGMCWRCGRQHWRPCRDTFEHIAYAMSFGADDMTQDDWDAWVVRVLDARTPEAIENYASLHWVAVGRKGLQ